MTKRPKHKKATAAQIAEIKRLAPTTSRSMIAQIVGVTRSQACRYSRGIKRRSANWASLSHPHSNAQPYVTSCGVMVKLSGPAYLALAQKANASATTIGAEASAIIERAVGAKAKPKAKPKRVIFLD